MALATILNLGVQLADDMLQRTVKQSNRGVGLPSGAVQERQFTLSTNSNDGTNAKVITSLPDAVLTVIVVDNPVDIQVTIGGQNITWTGVSFPLILPSGVTMVQFTNSGQTDVQVYMFQGA